jgi:hypothetical protein
LLSNQEKDPELSSLSLRLLATTSCLTLSNFLAGNLLSKTSRERSKNQTVST